MFTRHQHWDLVAVSSGGASTCFVDFVVRNLCAVSDDGLSVDAQNEQQKQEEVSHVVNLSMKCAI